MKMAKSNQKTEFCPHMSIMAILGGNTVYCNFNSDNFRIDYDPCAIHDGWIKRDECPLRFTYDEVIEKVKALAQKEGIDIRNVLNIRFEKKGKHPSIFKDVLDDLLAHVPHFEKNPKMCMTVLHVKIANLYKFLEHGYCWCDSKGRIENSEPFKVGDIGYINLINSGERNLPNVFLELFAEDVGVELLEGLPVNIDFLKDTLTKKDNFGLQRFHFPLRFQEPL